MDEWREPLPQVKHVSSAQKEKLGAVEVSKTLKNAN